MSSSFCDDDFMLCAETDWAAVMKDVSLQLPVATLPVENKEDCNIEVKISWVNLKIN